MVWKTIFISHSNTIYTYSQQIKFIVNIVYFFVKWILPWISCEKWYITLEEWKKTYWPVSEVGKEDVLWYVCHFNLYSEITKFYIRKYYMMHMKNETNIFLTNIIDLLKSCKSTDVLCFDLVHRWLNGVQKHEK